MHTAFFLFQRSYALRKIANDDDAHLTQIINYYVARLIYRANTEF